MSTLGASRSSAVAAAKVAALISTSPSRGEVISIVDYGCSCSAFYVPWLISLVYEIRALSFN
jgi:hypothetical protein